MLPTDNAHYTAWRLSCTAPEPPCHRTRLPLLDTPSSRIIDVVTTVAGEGGAITYREIADRAEIRPPGRIQCVTNTLEEMIRSDHAAGRPLRPAVAISRAGDGVPGPGFFQLCREISLYFGPDSGPQAALFHQIQRQRLHEFMEARAAADGDSG